MEMNGLNIDITVGEMDVLRAPSWWIDSLRGYPLGRAGITLPDPDGELYQSIAIGNAVSIEVCYRDQDPVSWDGTVSQVYPGETRDQLEVRAVDDAKPLTDVKILQSWQEETPEAIIAWAVRQIGLDPGVIDETGVVIPRFVASNIPVWQLVQQVSGTCSRSFGLDMSNRALWLGSAGVNWSDGDEPGAVPLITAADNLLDHLPATEGNAASMIETWLLPELSHSRRIHLQDDRRNIDTLLRAQRVRHEGTPDKARTFIWY